MAEKRISDWLNTAVSGIRFKPDRAAVEQELREHLEDKIEDLERFYHLSREEAEEMALGQMGDAEEIGREMVKIHRPWLGYLWQFSRILLVCLAVVWLFVRYLELSETTLRGWSVEPWDCVAPVTALPGEAELGNYTFSIREAVIIDYPEEVTEVSTLWDQVRVVFRVSTPRFWENINETSLRTALTVEMAEGIVYPMDRQTVSMKLGEYHRLVSGVEERKRGWFYREYVACAEIEEWAEGDWVTLQFDFAQGDVNLRAELARIEGEVP